MADDQPTDQQDVAKEQPSKGELWDEYFDLLVNDPEAGSQRRQEIVAAINQPDQDDKQGKQGVSDQDYPPFDESDPQWPKLDRTMSPFELHYANQNGYREARERELKALMKQGLSTEDWRRAEDELHGLRHGSMSRDDDDAMWGY